MSSLATVEEAANYLISGYWSERHWADTTITVNITSLSETEKTLARQVFDAWESVANLNFVETSGPANITYSNSGSRQATTSISVDGDLISSAQITISSDFWLTAQPGDYMFQTYLHETGHALGLGHLGPYNGSASYGVDNIFTNDSWQLSVMSYFDQATQGGGTRAYLVTPAMADIYAVQATYGAVTTSPEDTVYGFNSNADALYHSNAYAIAPAFTVYDSDGVDTFDFSGFAANQVINLGAGTWSSVGGQVNNVGIYLTSVIENAIGGFGNDVVYGNEVDNFLAGLAGNDRLYGDAGRDKLVGGRGRDILEGGPDRDIFDFNSIKDSKKGGQRDKILDFQRGIDDIDLRTIDAKKGGGNQKFKWIGKNDFHDKKGELHYVDKGSKVVVQGDVNGDGKADFEIYIKAGALSSHDFLL